MNTKYEIFTFRFSLSEKLLAPQYKVFVGNFVVWGRYKSVNARLNELK